MLHASRRYGWQDCWRRLREWLPTSRILPRYRAAPGAPLVVEPLEDRCLLTAPQIFLTPSVLANLRQRVADNTPGWQAFQSLLNSNLDVLIAENIGSFEGEQLDYIVDYALGYQVLMNSDPADADNYADKAIGLIKSGLDDYQHGDWVTRQFLARGDGVTRTFTLPNADFDPSTLTVYLSAVDTEAVVHQSESGQDNVGGDLIFLKASNTPDGPANYTEGTDWTHNPNFPNAEIDWSSAANQPAVGATYYVTYTSGENADATSAYTVNGDTITFAKAPAKNQAVFVEYIYGTHSSDGSTLAFQQTSAGDGGFNSIFIDDSYTYRYLGTDLAIGLDWLDGYVGMTPAFEQQIETMLVRWSNYIQAGGGFLPNSAASNYGATDYESEVMTALALAPRDTTDGPGLLTEALAARQNEVLPVIENPTTSDFGGYWAEGWNYGNQGVQALLIAADALQTAGLIDATPEEQWADQVMDSLVEEMSAPGLTYDGGEDYQYPFYYLDPSMFYVLSQMCASPAEQSYANYIIQNFPNSDFGEPERADDWRQFLFINPSAPAAFWSALPLADFASGTGLVVARSDWGPTPTWLAVQIGNLLNAGHQFDPGTMEINRGADQLLINAYQVYHVYSDDSLTPIQVSGLGNLLVVNDPTDERYPPNMGDYFGTPGVVDTAYENTDDFTYFDGDYAAAYSPEDDPGSGGQVSQLTRQVVYVRPGYIFVYDRAATTSASDEKILRWYFQKAPTVHGNSFVETVGGSRLFGQTYSTAPIATTLASIREYEGDAIDAPFALQQLDTQNITPTGSLRYLTVFQVTSSGITTMTPSEHIVSADTIMEGAEIGNQVVMFGRNGPVAAGATVTYTFSGSGAVQHLLVDLIPGQTYEVIIGGSVTLVSASDQGTLTFSTPAGVDSVTVTADRLVLTSPLSATFTVGENGAFQLTAQGYPTPSLTASGPLPTGVTFTDNGNGTATLAGTPAFGTSGTYSFTVTLHNGVVPDNSETFTLQDAFTNLLITAPAQVPTGESFSATVEVVDADGNPLTSFTGMVGLAVDDPAPGTLMGVTRVPVENGVATFSNLSLSTAGNYMLLAESDSDLIGSTAAVTALADIPATHFRISGAPASIAAGRSFNINITALDARNRVVTGFAGTIQLTSSDPRFVPVDYTFSPTDNGTLVVPVILETAGSRTLTVNDTARPTARGTSSSIKVTAGSMDASTVAGFPRTDVDTSNSNLGGSEPAIDVASPATPQAAALTPVARSMGGSGANLTAGITGPAGGVPGQPLTFTLSAVEDGAAPGAEFSYRINWIGKGTTFQVVSGVNGMTVTHVYPAKGNFTPTVIAIDSAGNASEPAAAPQQVGIVTVDMETDPVNSGETDLVIGGTPGKDIITITPTDTTGQVLSVSVNGVLQPNGPFAPTGRILVYGDGGNDLIKLVAGTIGGQPVPVAIPALLFGGAGNCTLSAAGSSANNILVGGAGNNALTGGTGRDILIGGAGAETLRAGSGGDLLIGGSTVYDANVVALLALMAEWQRNDISYQQRVQDLFVGGSGAANGATLLNALALTADNASDVLIGGSDADWFWLTDRPTSADAVSGFAPGEAATFLDR